MGPGSVVTRTAAAKRDEASGAAVGSRAPDGARTQGRPLPPSAVLAGPGGRSGPQQAELMPGAYGQTIGLGREGH